MGPLFELLAKRGGVDEAELYQVFNMGVGMVAVVAAERADAVLKFIRSQKHKAWLIGEVAKGTGEARVE
jgi:phosphoribosylformylglycinamidine cyclo-ligase